MKIKVSNNLTIEDTESNIILSHLIEKDGQYILTTTPINYGDELNNLASLLVYLSNNNFYDLPSSELDIKALGIK